MLLDFHPFKVCVMEEYDQFFSILFSALTYSQKFCLRLYFDNFNYLIITTICLITSSWNLIFPYKMLIAPWKCFVVEIQNIITASSFLNAASRHLIGYLKWAVAASRTHNIFQIMFTMFRISISRYFSVKLRYLRYLNFLMLNIVSLVF